MNQVKDVSSLLGGWTGQLGPLRLEHPFILAPMAGITHSSFRRQMRRHQSAAVISELISASGLHHGGERTRELMRFHEEERPVGLQIFGESTELLCQAAQAVEAVGADFVDLNLGCPVPKVVKNGGGAALCRDVVALGKLLTAMVQAVKIPVTIKIRTGWDAASMNAPLVARVAEEAGVGWVAIHGRTRAQGYSGLADWELIGEVKAKVGIPILGNGDILTPEEAVSRLATFGVDGVLIGRGALRNPFIFEQAQALWQGQEVPVLCEQAYSQWILEQKELLLERFPPQQAMVQARKFLAWYSSGFAHSSEFRARLFKLTDPESFWVEALQFFRQEEVGIRNLAYLAEPFLQGGHG